MVKQITLNKRVKITLSPNRSASWTEVKAVVLMIAIIVLLIASIWALLGVWLILPFAGFEIALLAFLMYKVNLNCHSKQVLTIDDKNILIECGIQHPVFSWRFDRAITHLSVVEAENSFDRPQMILSDENISIELGQFLNQQDCIIARNLLKQIGVMEVSNKWWQQH